MTTFLQNNIGPLVLKARMSAAKWQLLKPTLRDAQNPDVAQRRLLRRIVSDNANTEFGRKYGFAGLDDAEAWRKAVPIHDYEQLRPWIESQIDTGAQSLTAEAPIIYAMTSGTIAKPKYIPVTRSGLNRHKRNQLLFSSALYDFDPGLFAGRIFGLSSPGIEGRLENGIPYGSVSGFIYRQTPALIRSRYLLPPEIFEISDYDKKYRVIAERMMSEENVSLAVVANPSSMLRLLQIINTQLEELLAGAAKEFPVRGRALSRIAETKGRLDIDDIWPNLKGLVTWTGGSCAVALDALRDRLGSNTRVLEFGYAASEFRGTVNIDPANNLCLPTIDDVYFEFVDAKTEGLESAEFKSIEQLERGQRYYIIVTTPDGLYRYNINDIVEVTGFIGATPTLAFVQKGQGITNITGEKLSESQMGNAVQVAASQIGTRTIFFKALADEERQRYNVYVEVIGQSINLPVFTAVVDETLMGANVEYRDKRKSGRLHPPIVKALRSGAEDAHRRFALNAGQREGQYKVLTLDYVRNSHFDFDEWVLDGSDR